MCHGNTCIHMKHLHVNGNTSFICSTVSGEQKFWLVIKIMKRTSMRLVSVVQDGGLGETQVTNIDGLVQERRNSSALAMELCLSCTNPSIS